MTKTVYDFEVETIDGKVIDLEQFSGKTLLVVNVASQCGFTKQYEELQGLYKKHASQGLEILGFPCDQFGGQEPGTNKEISSFCSLNYGVTFPLFSKIEVNGTEAHALYQFLKREKPGLMGMTKIKWNFTKFLVDKKGKPVKRYGPPKKPKDIEPDILKIL